MKSVSGPHAARGLDSTVIIHLRLPTKLNTYGCQGNCMAYGCHNNRNRIPVDKRPPPELYRVNLRDDIHSQVVDRTTVLVLVAMTTVSVFGCQNNRKVLGCHNNCTDFG